MTYYVDNHGLSGDVICCQCLRCSTSASNLGTPSKCTVSATVVQSSKRTVADGHRVAAYHNKR